MSGLLPPARASLLHPEIFPLCDLHLIILLARQIMRDAARKQRPFNTQEFDASELERFILVLQGEAVRLKRTAGEQLMHAGTWLLVYVLALLLPPLADSGGGGMAPVILGPFVFLALLSIVVMLAVLVVSHRRRLARIRELGMGDFYKKVAASPSRWTFYFLQIFLVIPILLIFIVSDASPSGNTLQTLILILGPILTILYFLGRAYERLAILRGIKSWKEKLSRLESFH